MTDLRLEESATSSITESVPGATPGTPLPFISVIMPVRNEADFIERAIRSVLGNDYPRDRVEILVVDGMSDDGTREMVQTLADADGRIKLLDNPMRIVPTAMNIGLKAAKGDMFIRLDGHAETAKDFIAASVDCLAAHPDAWVAGGPIRTVSRGYMGGAIASAMRSPVGVGDARFRLGGYEGWVDTLAFGVHHAWVVERVGYFDEELVRNQDDEFNLRIILAGGKIWMSRTIQSTYHSRTSFGRLWRQYFQYGFWRIRTLQKHGRLAGIRQLVPLLFVSSMLVLVLASIAWWPFRWALAAEAGLYVLALIAGALDVGRKSGWRYAPSAPAVFVLLHFGYGSGSLWGAVRFHLFGGRGMKKLDEMRMSR